MHHTLAQSSPDSGLPEEGSLPSFFRRRGADRGGDGAGASAAGAGGGLAAGLGAGSVFGDFRLIRKLGEGGMGQVWEAEQISLRRRVALKLLRSEALPSERALAIFEHEARMGGRLNHPGIVSVLAYGKADEVPFIAQELVGDGWSLKNVLQEARLAPELEPDWYERVAEFFAAAAEALAVAHEAEVIHRDLKPANILVGEDDRPKIADFGLAKVSGVETISHTGELAGTWCYMSPEQALAKRVEIDARTDVFSLGTTLYEALTLQRAFDGDSQQQVTAGILWSDPPDPRTIRSKVPADLAVICAKAMEKRPADRYPSMAEFAADIRRHLGNEPITARPAGPWLRTSKWIRRHPTKAVALGLTAVALVAISALAKWQFDTAQQLATRNDELSQTISARDTALSEAQAQRDRADATANQLAARNDELTATVSARDEALSEAQAQREQADAKTAEAQAAATRAEAERANVLRLSAFQELEDLQREANDLWPPTPELLPVYDAWLARAAALVAGLEPAADGSDPGHRAALATLRERALPQSKSERESDREKHPRFAELQSLQARLAWMHQVRAVRGRSAQPDAFSLDPALTDQKVLRKRAWELVDPDRTVFGRESEGLALALRAYGATVPQHRAYDGDTLAWALFANGLDDEALAIEQEAVEAAAPEDHAAYAGYLARLEQAVEEARSAGFVAEMTRLQGEADALLREVAARRTWRFADADDTWWHNQLTKLIEQISEFADPDMGLIEGLSPTYGWGIARRREFAASVEERTVTGSEAIARWAVAIASIGDPEQCPAYDGLQLSPQLGLLPLGRDPDSGLWEFWHLMSGDEPVLGPEGHWRLTAESGLVLVLIPGGSFWMGAQADHPEGRNDDPDAAGDESPVHEVTLSPYFLSKYELTQGQWERFSGSNPSSYGPNNFGTNWDHTGHGWTALHPVEQVSWNDCVETLSRLGLSLPSEAQWENGCRAGTSTVYWSGDEPQSLQDVANLADQYGKDHGTSGWTSWESWLDDGATVHAEVGSYRPNGFGLYDTHGNVWEWCLDGWDSSFYAQSAGTDPLRGTSGHAYRVNRGGSFSYTAVIARSADRNYDTPGDRINNLGARPAMGIAP